MLVSPSPHENFVSIFVCGQPHCKDDVMIGVSDAGRTEEEEEDQLCTAVDVLLDDPKARYRNVTTRSSQIIASFSSESVLEASVMHEEEKGEQMHRSLPQQHHTVRPDCFVLTCREGDTSSVAYLQCKILPVLLASSASSSPSYYNKSFEKPFVLCVVKNSNDHHEEQIEGGKEAWTATLTKISEQVSLSDRYYGLITIQENRKMEEEREGEEVLVGQSWLPLFQAVVEMTLAPTHLIYSRTKNCFTPMGKRAVTRAFWMFDADGDKVLNNAETLNWRKVLFEEEEKKEAEEGENKEGKKKKDPIEDIDELKTFLSTIQFNAGGAAKDLQLMNMRGITIHGFLAVLEAMLLQHRSNPVWSVLFHTGIQVNGLPYTSTDLRSILRSDAKSTLHLSTAGEHFFSTLFVERKFSTQQAQAWEFTPGCPWTDIEGLPHPEDEVLSLEQFIACWRVMALYNKQAVVQFARTWGYRGSPQSLFTKRKKREFRESEADVHCINTIQAIIVGSVGSGKTSLLKRLTDRDFIDDEVSGQMMNAGGGGESLAYNSQQGGKHRGGGAKDSRYTCFAHLPNKKTASGGCSMILYHKLAFEECLDVLADESRMSQVDVVLMAFSASDPHSFSYLTECYEELKKYQPCLPCMLVLTKADECIVDPISKISPESFASREGLVWPPLITSIYDEELSVSGMKSDVEGINQLVFDAAVYPEACRTEVITTGRKIRRAVVVAVAATIVYFAARGMYHFLFGGKKPTVAPTSSLMAGASKIHPKPTIPAQLTPKMTNSRKGNWK